MDDGDQRLRNAQGDHSRGLLRRYQLQGTLAAGGSASAMFMRWDSGSSTYIADGAAFTLYSFHLAAGVAGEEGDCAYFADRRKWEAIEAGAALYIGILTAPLSPASSAPADRYTGTPGAETDSGTDDTVNDWLLLPSQTLPTGTKIVYGLINGHLYVISAACPALS
ncbi:MAG TPA: hypothetical protein VGX76_05060 [Pirellulales bacterium]|jgi:hypothetical protein|nr:hypothetical protein [Pirellulales bacterium]